VPADNKNLINSTGANSKFSPFVIAIKLAGIKVLPSIFNAIITISVISVANSCTFGSTRTMQALAERGMGPKFLSYVDSKGRPIWGIAIQLCFGLLAYIGETSNESTIFDWLLSLSGLSDFFVWGMICLAHIRFRSGWKSQGHEKHELPFQAMFGVVGSYYGLFLNAICIIATFYTAAWPIGEAATAQTFFQVFLAGPIIVALYVGYKLYSREWKMFVTASEMDLATGLRRLELDDDFVPTPKTWRNVHSRLFHALF